MSENPRDIPGRAMDYEAKRVIVDKLLGAWMIEPSLRLGQLITNSLHYNGVEQLFYVEDEKLAQKVTEFVTREK